MASSRRLALEVALAYAASLGAFALLVVPRTGLMDVDPYYHFMVSKIIGQTGLFVDIGWLPMTAVGPDGPDAHWGFHLLTAPLTWLHDDPFLSLKWCIACTAALVPAWLYAVARTRGLAWPALWAVLAVTGGLTMPARLVVLRAQTVAIGLVAAHIVALAERRWRLLGVLSFVFLQTYHGAVIAGPLVLGWVAVTAVRHRRFEWQPLLWSAGGGALALVVNPWLPHNVEFLFFHTLFTAASHTAGEVGEAAVEWLAPSGWAAAWDVWPTHLSMLAGIAAVAMRWGRGARLSEEAPLFALSAALFFVMYLGAQRFAEYYVPVGVVCGAVLLRDAGVMQARTGRRLLLAALVAVLAWQIPRDVDLLTTSEVFGPDRYARIGAFLRERAEPGEMVYNASYDTFPMLVYHAPDQRYVAGLDPRYLEYGDPERYELWRLTQRIAADEPADPAPILSLRFGTRWIVAEAHLPGLRARLRRSKAVEEVVSDEDGSLFRMR